MGMIGNFFRTDENIVRKIQKSELSLIDLLYDENKKVDANVILDIDKSWHAIHFTLSGKVWDSTKDDLSKVILSGTIVNDEDMGYGPAMFVTNEEIHKINIALKTVSKDLIGIVYDMVAEAVASYVYN